MILGCDPGLRNGGYAVVSPRGVVVDLDIVCTDPDREVGVGVDRRRRLGMHRERVLELIHEHNVTLIAAESIALPHGKSSTDASASAFMTWAMLDTVASMIGVDLVEVRPQQWQRAILPNADAKRLDYAQVYVALEKYVIEQKREALLAITKSKREHALDACGVGIYAALTPREVPEPIAQHGLFDETEQRAERMMLRWEHVVARLRKGSA